MKAKLLVLVALAVSLLFVGTAFAQRASFYPQGVETYVIGDGVDLQKESPEFIRGDYNVDGALLTNDPIMELQWIFGVPGAPPPSCEDAADYDDDGFILTNDPIMALQYIFGVPGAPPPQPPFGTPPGDCGPDPTDDGLDCTSYPPCP